MSKVKKKTFGNSSRKKIGNDLKNSNFAYCVLNPGKLETFFLYMGRHFEVAPNISHQAF